MASDYGLNFGFRRSDESVAIREGRLKTPATGAELLQGSLVEIDAATPGYLKAAPADAAGVTGLVGLLVQEESHIFSAFVEHGHDSYSLGNAKVDTHSVMWSGPGTKVWFRNTPARSHFGRTKAAVQICDLTGVAVGDSLGWDGAKYVKADGTTVPKLMTVTQVSGTGATDWYCEAVLTF